MPVKLFPHRKYFSFHFSYSNKISFGIFNVIETEWILESRVISYFFLILLLRSNIFYVILSRQFSRLWMNNVIIIDFLIKIIKIKTKINIGSG